MPTDLDDEFDEPDLADEELDEDELVDEELDEGLGEDLDDLVAEEDAEDEEAPSTGTTPRKRKKGAPEEEEEEEEEEVDDDDIEADLDTILKDRIASADDADEEDEEDDAGLGGESGGRVQPRGDTEFVCQNCFLVKHVSQRVEGSSGLCVDCA